MAASRMADGGVSISSSVAAPPPSPSPARTMQTQARRAVLGPLSLGAEQQQQKQQHRRMTLDNSHLKDKVSPSSSSKKRRSQSMSGMASLDGIIDGGDAGGEGVRGAAPITVALGMAGELISPRKKQRTSLAPRKSILKPANSNGSIHDLLLQPQLQSHHQEHTGNFTTTFYATASYNGGGSREGSHEDGEAYDSQGATTGDMTLNLTARRQDRRVSFAPSAQMREFTIDNGDDSISHSGTSPARPPSSSSHQPPILDISAAIAQASASLAVVEVGKQPSPRRRSSTTSSSRNAAGHRRRSSVANVAAMVESLTPSPTPSPNIEQESAFQPSAAAHGNTTIEDPDASSMNIADPDQVTTAFRSHFVFPRTSLGGLTSAVHSEDARDSFEDDDDQDNNTEASGMVLADEDEGDVTSAFASNTHLFGSSAGRSRQSLAFPSTSTAAPVPFPAPQPESTTGQPSLSRRASYGLAPSPSKKVRAMQELAARRGSLPASAHNNSNHALLFQDIPRAPAPAPLALSKSVPASTSSSSSTASKGRQSLGFSFGPDRQIPLGNAGLDAEEAAKLRAEKAKRGSMAFYAASSSSSSTSAGAGASSASASAIATTSTSTSTSIFAVHHSPNLDEDRHEEEGGEEQSEEMDMSIADTRRVSNVFARAFLAPEEQDEQEESGEQQEYATGSPSPGKQQYGGGAGLYPSLSGLGFDAPTSVGLGFTNSNSGGAIRTEGQNALAFLDDDNNEEEEGQEDEDSWLAGREAAPEQQEQNLQAGHQSTFTVRSDVGEAVVESQIAAADDDHAQVENRPSMEEQDHALSPETEETEASPEQQIYHPLPDPVFVPRASRLSIVQERPLEEEEEEEEEEDEDSDNEGTRDMDITGVFGSQQSAPRRLSIAHPTSLKSPARSAIASAAGVASPGNSKIPITARRLSVAATPLGEKTLTPSTAAATKSPFRAVPPLTAVPSSPAQNQGKDRQQLITGLTPNMKKLSDWSAGGSARKPIPAAATQRASSVALPPTSDGFNDFAPDASSRAHSEPLGGAGAAAAAAANAEHETRGGGDNSIPGMSLDQFLGMADMQFMDGLLSVSQGAAVKSRSSGKKSLGGAGLDKTATMMGDEGTREGETEAKEVTLTEQVVASGAVIPMMESLQMMMRELRGSLRENSQIMDDLEEFVEDEQPALFSEYAAADPETRQMMDQYFKLVRLYYRQESRREWYEYRSSVFDALLSSYAANLSGLEKDLSIVTSTQGQLSSSLPSLRKRAAEITSELAREKARNSTLAEADQEHLAELREAWKEQNASLEDYKRDVAESEAGLERVQEKEDELAALAKEARNAIENSRKVCEGVKYYTKAEMYRLQDELDLLQYLHGWNLVQFDSTHIELSHRGELGCTLLLKAGGRVEDFEVLLLDTTTTSAAGPEKTASESELKRNLTSFFFDRLQSHLQHIPANLTAKDLLRHISSLWSSARKLRSELLLVSLRYPLSISLLSKKSKPGQLALKASARIYALTAQSEFSVVFEVTGEEMAHPSTGEAEGITAGVGVSVEVAYGDVDRDELVYIVRERISSSEPKALLEACQEAEAKYT